MDILAAAAADKSNEEKLMQFFVLHVSSLSSISSQVKPQGRDFFQMNSTRNSFESFTK
jgi:hypothetical protein